MTNGFNRRFTLSIGRPRIEPSASLNAVQPPLPVLPEAAVLSYLILAASTVSNKLR